MDKNDQEVYFWKYCKTCDYSDLDGHKDPCNDCLDCPVNDGTHKPVNWKEKE